MATTTSHNKKSSAVKRILSEAKEFSEADTEFTANPLEDNIFEWHFTLRGPSSSEFQEGIYHGRILLPAEYPFRPPDVMLLTPNGRWELNKKICLTFTGFHEEMWQPAWGIRTALIGVQAFMGARAEAAVGVGSLDYPEEERERLAKRSQEWMCPTCKVKNSSILRSNGTRKEEVLPEGLTIDPHGSAQKAKEEKTDLGEESSRSSPRPVETLFETISTIQNETTAQNGHSFGASGPSDSLVASIVNGRSDLDSSIQKSSVASSRVTSGINTPIKPIQPVADETSSSPSLKDKEVVANSMNASKSSQSSLETTTTLKPDQKADSIIESSSQSQGQSATRPAAVIALHSTREPERRLAMLDRAIATVLFLLLALLLRRVLNVSY